MVRQTGNRQDLLNHLFELMEELGIPLAEEKAEGLVGVLAFLRTVLDIKLTLSRLAQGKRESLPALITIKFIILLLLLLHIGEHDMHGSGPISPFGVLQLKNKTTKTSCKVKF